MGISWSSPLVLQIIIIMITPDGSNSQRASTSGLPLMLPEPLALAGLEWCLSFSPHFAVRKLEFREA